MAERPPVWVGHIALGTDELAASHDFMVKLGMRSIVVQEDVAVLELRGGTHLVLLPADGRGGTPAGFDLMVEDLDATHAGLSKLGLSPSQIERGTIHDSFVIHEPGGHPITFNSTHVSDQPV